MYFNTLVFCLYNQSIRILSCRYTQFSLLVSFRVSMQKKYAIGGNLIRKSLWCNLKTRLKRLPVISREHFRKTRTNYFYKHIFGISNTNLQNGISNTIAKKRRLHWYFKYQLVLRVPIGTSSTNRYFNYQLVLRIPIGTSNTNRYFEYHE
jgi:hypothetical protein